MKNKIKELGSITAMLIASAVSGNAANIGATDTKAATPSLTNQAFSELQSRVNLISAPQAGNDSSAVVLQHRSHVSHTSHRSHVSHTSHRSHYSGF